MGLDTTHSFIFCFKHQLHLYTPNLYYVHKWCSGFFYIQKNFSTALVNKTCSPNKPYELLASTQSVSTNGHAYQFILSKKSALSSSYMPNQDSQCKAQSYPISHHCSNNVIMTFCSLTYSMCIVTASEFM